jgi:tetratricopeptide (TPR) repeat protein
MSTSLQWRAAQDLFNAGFSLFEEMRYEQAIDALLKAEAAFRALDARGHPRGHFLENGVSGLANTLALLGRCHQELGHYDEAVTCYETSLINEKFERRKPFVPFLNELRKNLASCYERRLSQLDDRSLQFILDQDIELDTSFRFPFSLQKNAIPIARLYELDPVRYQRFKDFYLRSRTNDTALRRQAGKGVDETRMKRATFWIWVFLGIMWIIYSIIMVKALLS